VSYEGEVTRGGFNSFRGDVVDSSGSGSRFIAGVCDAEEKEDMGC